MVKRFKVSSILPLLFYKGCSVIAIALPPLPYDCLQEYLINTYTYYTKLHILSASTLNMIFWKHVHLKILLCKDHSWFILMYWSSTVKQVLNTSVSKEFIATRNYRRNMWCTFMWCTRHWNVLVPFLHQFWYNRAGNRFHDLPHTTRTLSLGGFSTAERESSLFKYEHYDKS